MSAEGKGPEAETKVTARSLLAPSQVPLFGGLALWLQTVRARRG